MNIRGFTLALVLCASALAACQQASLVPQGGPVSVSAAVNDAVSLHLPDGISLPDATNICHGIKPASVPGKHVLMFADGNVAGSKFSGAGLWFLEPYAKGTPGPTPTPGVTPTPGKIKIKEWLYYGTYALQKKKESGCVFLLATQSGKPMPKSKYNAFAIGTVIVVVKYLRVGIPTTTGPVMIAISGISATSGTGTATLSTTKGAAYDTASITLVGRVSFN